MTDFEAYVAAVRQHHTADTAVLISKETLFAGADEIELLRAKLPRWVPVAERLPGETGLYLVMMVEPKTTPEPESSMAIACFLSSDREWIVGGDIVVTHWMPLPVPPKEPTP